MIKFENVNVTMQGKRILSDIRMKQLSEEKHIIIVVTHDYEFLTITCNRILHLDEGKLTEDYALDNKTVHKLWTFFNL